MKKTDYPANLLKALNLDMKTLTPDQEKTDQYAAQAKALWGETNAYKEYEKKSSGRSHEENQALGHQLMDIFDEFGKIKEDGPDSTQANALVKKLQNYITEYYYTCTDETLITLGQMYAAGGEMTTKIDQYAGEGTAVFVNEAIKVYASGKFVGE